jgi:RimJ/RimL family protein N-acetyltransferase
MSVSRALAAVEVREIGPDDLGEVRRLHQEMSPDDFYLRFFGHGTLIADEVSASLCREQDYCHAALGGWVDGELAGVVNFEPSGCPGVAEIALIVAAGMRHRGVGTLLLRRLVTLARARGVREFRADVHPHNRAVLRVLASAGMPVRSRYADGVIEITMPLVAASGP